MRLNAAMRGVSLMETVVYLALASLIVSGIIASSYPLFANTERETAETARNLDAAFVTQKILLVLNTASSITAPAVGTMDGPSLSAVTDDGTVVIALVDGAITLDRGAGMIPLTASWVTASNLVFARVAGTGGAPDTISFGFSLNGVSVEPVARYVRN